MDKLIVTAAICGAEVTRKDTPHIPYTAGELAAEALACQQAGASVIHIHVREDDGTPSQSPELYRRAIEEMKAAGVEAIIQPSTGGAVGMDYSERRAPLDLEPEMASLDCGSINFGDEVFINDRNTMRRFALEMTEKGILPELECFEAGHIRQALALRDEGLLPGHLHFGLVMGVGIGGGPEDLRYMSSLLPEGCTWSAAGVGRYQLPVTTAAILAGGHARVGLEDNIYYAKGRHARGSSELVERVSRLAAELGRPVAGPDEARKILELDRLRRKA